MESDSWYKNIQTDVSCHERLTQEYINILIDFTSAALELGVSIIRYVYVVAMLCIGLRFVLNKL